VRYSPRPLPPYRYRPGRSPHPERHPGGHARDLPPREPEPLDPARWWQCSDWLYAVDLFNGGYWWECHEVVEGLWRRAGRRSALGRRLQGLVQVAAALLRHDAGSSRGARDLARRARAGLGDAPFLGLDPSALTRELDAWLDDRAERPPHIHLAMPGG